MNNSRRLITSALPYVNNVPHLGNLIQMLSADVFARFCRSRGYDTLYVCGTDEYGTATETRAMAERTSPKELCDRYHELHKDVYKWFGIKFDYFGRTSTPQQTEIVQDIFRDLDRNGYVSEHSSRQLFCPDCGRFLADRYVRGVCPKCGCEDARGDQCEACGALLDPTDLRQPRCSTCGGTPELRDTKHLYINLPAIQEKYQAWMAEASRKGGWAENALQMTRAWIRDGLQERAITRDLKWGIPVPKEGYEDKVFYVWFDAPIGYISITKALADSLAAEGRDSFDWKSWWLPGETADGGRLFPVDLFQFIGKDNIPFHTVIFPSSLIGTGRDWTKLFHMSSTEYLNYEGGKFSKSKGVGVFGTDAKESGIPADAWRFYIFYNRPEKSDFQFTWKDFQEKLNSELVGNLGNLVNRTLLFVNKYYGGVIPDAPADEALWTDVRAREEKVAELLERAELKEAFRALFAISDVANKAFQAGEPWKARVSAPERAASLIHNLCYVIKDLMIMMHPYLPDYTSTVMSYFGRTIADPRIGEPAAADGLRWSDVGVLEGLSSVGATDVYFRPMDAKTMQAFRGKFSGAQGGGADAPNCGKPADGAKSEKKAEAAKTAKNAAEPSPLPPEQQPAHFAKYIRLTVAKIVRVERNPDSDKLYVEHLDDGSGTDRVIQSGLVPYLTPEQLLGKHIILVDNLKPRKMRGIESRGMLLAADYTDADGAERVEVLEAPWAAPGTPVVLEGDDALAPKPDSIDADVFFQLEISVADKAVVIAGKKLVAADRAIATAAAENGGVH